MKYAFFNKSRQDTWHIRCSILPRCCTSLDRMKENKLYCSYLIPLSHPPLPSSMFRIGKDFEDDFDFLLQGISNFDLATASLSEVLVHGPLAFPIGTTKGGQTFLAGAYYGQGRVIVVTHEELLEREVENLLA